MIESNHTDIISKEKVGSSLLTNSNLDKYTLAFRHCLKLKESAGKSRRDVISQWVFEKTQSYTYMAVDALYYPKETDSLVARDKGSKSKIYLIILSQLSPPLSS